MTAVLLDQGLPRSTPVHLQAAGWDAVHVGDLAMSRASDAEILDYARRQQRVVITLDADFHALLAVQNQSAPSVVRIRIEGLKGEEIAALLLRIWPQIDAAMASGAVASVTRRRVRVHRLPIG